MTPPGPGPVGRRPRDLVEEAKKRIVLLLICAFGLAYLMSLTSSSVWINLPAAASLIIFLRYISFDLDVRRRTVAREKQNLPSQQSRRTLIEFPNGCVEKSSWRRKVNSPAVEEAIDQFNKHIISEWVTDLWYSRITPDKDGPEELVQIMNDVLGEISYRTRDINLIDLLIRDIVNLFCNHLELFRACESKIGHKEFVRLPADLRDKQLRLVLAAENSLHPGLFSVEAEHKVLQHLMSGLVSLTFKPKDLQCSFFRYTVRELLSCAVMRPVLNLANPRVINEKIEALALSFSNKAKKDAMSSTKGTSSIKPTELPHFDFQDRSTVGVELVQLKQLASNGATKGSANGNILLKGIEKEDDKKTGAHHSRGEWGRVLDKMSTRKSQALAPEHLENMWTKGRNYRKKESANALAQQPVQKVAVDISDTSHKLAKHSVLDATVKSSLGAPGAPSIVSCSNYPTLPSYQRKALDQLEQGDIDSESLYPTEDDESNNVTGLDSPGTRVWDSKNKMETAKPRIRHPLENLDGKLMRKSVKGQAFHPRASRRSGRKRYEPVNHKVPAWEEVDRSSYLFGDGHDISNTSKEYAGTDDSSDNSEAELWGRAHSGATTSSSMSSVLTSEAHNLPTKSTETLVFDDSFLKLRCEVQGANIVKSGSVTFAVYAIAVTDADNNCWSIKRRFRHFEELHRRLKEFQEYNLSLPPKHFLSSGLDVTVVQERCTLLDRYLKKLLQLPTVSRSIEVWDFLSVDSQTYIFSDSLSIIQTLSVTPDQTPCAKGGKSQITLDTPNYLPVSKGEHLGHNVIDYNHVTGGSKSDNFGITKRNSDQNVTKSSRNNDKIQQGISGDLEKPSRSPIVSESPVKSTTGGAEGPQDVSQILVETNSSSTIPTEWAQPNLSVPILDLVDVVFQLQDGGWIRRQAFWVAKQVLQLGMGDAFDDWLLEKIQLLRKGSVIASAINRVEQILWPDGIFITKHPSRRHPTPQSSPKEESSSRQNTVENQLTDEQLLEASRRAKFVHELIIDKAPAALVGLVGRKEYERCAQDVYFFLQSSVCLKQFAFELLELLLLAAFPELDDAVRHCHEDKEFWKS